jgi:hypothetical protein
MSKFCWLPTIAIVLVACNPKQQPARDAETDVTEAIEFELIRALDAQGQFRLSNQTSQPISFRASDENAEGVHPEDAHLKCNLPVPTSGTRARVRWATAKSIASSCYLDRKKP